MAGVVIDKTYTGKEVMEIILSYKNLDRDCDLLYGEIPHGKAVDKLYASIAELFNDMHFFKKGDPVEVRKHNMAGGAWLRREYYDYCDKTGQYIVIYHPANGEPKLEFCEEVRVPRSIL